MIIVQGYMQVLPEKYVLYQKRIAIHMAFVAALDGCLQYSISHDPATEGKLWVAERWRDKAAQAAHMAGEHMAEFTYFMRHMKMKSAHIAAYEVVDDGKWLMRIDQP
jgi:quinol monooxygenase YgiN